MRYSSHHQYPSKNINLMMALTEDKDRLLRGKVTTRTTPQQSYDAVPVSSVPSKTVHTRGSSSVQAYRYHHHHPSPTSSSSAQEDAVDKSIAKGGVTTPFPWKLHEMLDDMAESNDHSVVCWQPHGRAFMVHNTKEFVTRIMPIYFNQTKYASFQRQLNLYGFSRLSHGKDKGAYYHPCFVRGQRSLCRNMIRQKIKGTKVRRSLSVEEEPNFYDPQYLDKSIPSPVLPITPHQEQQGAPSPAGGGAVPKKKVPSATTVKTPRRRANSISKRRTNNNNNKCNKSSMSNEALPPAPAPPIQPSLVSLMRKSTASVVAGGRADKAPPQIPVLSLPPMLRQLYVVPPSSVGLSSPTSTAVQHHHHTHHHRNHHSGAAVKGGDLLYFEGQPFRYLEHIDDIPSQPPSLATTAQGGASSTLHEMISSIVSMENQWPAAPRPTGQELYSR